METRLLIPCSRRDGSLWVVLIAAVLASNGSVQAQNAAGKAWFETITVNGFLSSTYSYNMNRPDTRTNSYRVFDQVDNSFKLDVFELAMTRNAEFVNDVGFCARIAAGSSIPKVSRSSGLNCGDLDIQQAYVTWMAPVGSGLRIDAGKFVTPAGYELIDGFDGYNDNISRSFLFGYAIPFTHTGLRIGYRFSKMIAATVYLVNGWDNSIENNSSKTIGTQFALTPIDGLVFFVNGFAGPERNDNSSDQRMLVDFNGTWSPLSFLTIGANADAGYEQKALDDGADARWSGFAGYIRAALSSSLSLSVRGELFNDADGYRTGTKQKLMELTLTPEYRISGNLVFRVEYRLDNSDKDVFFKRSDAASSQSTVGANLIYVF